LFVTLAKKSAWICCQLKVDGRSRAEEIIPWSDQNREEVLTDTAAAQINDARVANMKGLGNAFDNDESTSSKWLRIKDFLQRNLRDRPRFGWLRHDGYVGINSRHRRWQFASNSTQAR
jgi:hypothetical protein